MLTSTVGPSRDVRSRLQSAITALERQPAGPAQRLALAEAHFRIAVDATDPRDGIAHLRAAIGIDDLQPKFHFHLGRLLHKVGDAQAAVCSYRQTTRLAPSSHRAFAHLALALVDCGDPARTIGQNILDALGRSVALPDAGPAIDELIRTWIDRSTTRSKRAPSAGAAPEPCRYRSVPQMVVVDQLSRPKIQRRTLDRSLTAMKSSAAESALAWVQLLLAGESPADVRRMVDEEPLAAGDDVAVNVARRATELALIQELPEFVERAVASVRDGDLPPELVASLHYIVFGRNRSIPLADCLRAFNQYPADMRNQPAFVELRIALLDGYARTAWNDGAVDRARVLWREIAALDPYRIETAHNLALVASRTKSFEDYGPAWARAIELRYLQAAAADEVLSGVEDRRLMHLSILQQAEGHTENITLADPVVDIILRQWALYYVNARLAFRSPVHLLGISRDAPPADTEAARDVLIDFCERALTGIAGGRLFADLAGRAIDAAFARASMNIERIRDASYESERAEADRLAADTVGRALQMLGLAQKALQDPSGVERAIRIAQMLCGLPWMTLQPAAERLGYIKPDTNLKEIIATTYLSLAATDPAWRPATKQDVDERLARARRDLRSVYPTTWPADATDVFFAHAGNVALAALQKRLADMKPADDLAAIDSEFTKALEMLPAAHQVRINVAVFLVGTREPARIERAIAVLKEGLALKPRDEIETEMRRLLADAEAALPSARQAAQVRALIDPASRQLSSALQALNANQGAAQLKEVARTAKEAVNAGERALKIAIDGGDGELISEVRSVLEQFRSVAGQLSGVS